MIYSFLGKDRIIELFPKAVREGCAPHLFNTDSMTLVVGPNDSGKTRLLAQICHSVADGIDEVAEGDVSLSNVGVVYYSPAPFDAGRFPSNRRRRVEIRSPSSGKSQLSPELLTKLRSTFGFTATRRLKLRVLPEDGVAALVSAAMEIPSKIGTFPELKSALQYYHRASTDWHAGGESGVSISTAQDEMVAAQRQLKRAVHELARERLGRVADLYLISLGLLNKGGKQGRQRILEFWGFLDGAPPSESLTMNFDNLYDLSHLHKIEDLICGVELDDAFNVDELERFMELVAIELDGLSSGAEALVRQFYEIGSAIDRLASVPQVKSILVLIDEGDAFLHLAWQQRYIMFLDQFLGSKLGDGTPIQAVVATHSPVLMSDFPRDYIVRMGGGEELRSELISFAAPLEKIVESTAGAGSIGKVAVRVISEQIKLGNNADRQVVDWVDDPLLKEYLMRKIEHAG